MVATHPYDKIVYLLQGGGALGSYQVGVCEAFIEYGLKPDWLVGTSIGAINAAILVGNKPENQIKKLNEFWDIVSIKNPFVPVDDHIDTMQKYFNYISAQWIAMSGVPGFFSPQIFYPLPLAPQTPDYISFYDTKALRDTLLNLIDFDIINSKQTRLTLSAVCVRTSKTVRFDNYNQMIEPEHIMASCALPPGFPAVKIQDEYYWDGGISSNTPFRIILEEKIPYKLLCIIINLFTYPDKLPDSMLNVINARKDIEYASRHHEIIEQFCELHFLQKTILALSKEIKDEAVTLALKKIKEKSHPKDLNIAQFHYKDSSSDLWSKDYNFSMLALKKHREMGYHDAKKALENPEWLDSKVDNDLGVIMHHF